MKCLSFGLYVDWIRFNLSNWISDIMVKIKEWYIAPAVSLTRAASFTLLVSDWYAQNLITNDWASCLHTGSIYKCLILQVSTRAHLHDLFRQMSKLILERFLNSVSLQVSPWWTFLKLWNVDPWTSCYVINHRSDVINRVVIASFRC